MKSSVAKVLPPTLEEIEIARRLLRSELVKSEGQQEETMRSADAVFAEKRKKLEELLNAKVQSGVY